MLYQYTLYSKVQFNRQEIKRLLTVIIRHGIVNSSHKTIFVNISKNDAWNQCGT